jgi:hypothetical protein
MKKENKKRGLTLELQDSILLIADKLVGATKTLMRTAKIDDNFRN